MFESLPHHFRKHNLEADVRTLLLLRKSMEKGLVNTLGDLYLVLKGLITMDPKDLGPYTTAFYDYFLNIEIKKGERLETAILRSETFQEWKAKLDEEWEEPPSSQELADRFIHEIHATTLDIKRIVSGKDILNNSDPNQVDPNPYGDNGPPDTVTEAADYREVSLKELRERLKKIAQNQSAAHNGGTHWVGTGGRSPFGNNGAALGGMRIGGGGGGKMARAVIGDPRFYPVDTKVALTDDQIDVALALLKGIQEESAELKLDIPVTIKEGLKQGGIFLPHEREEISQKVQVILIIDNGGMSMTPYIRTVTRLFSKMKTRFAHDLKTYYYHNTIYKGVFEDASRRTLVPIEKITKLNKNYSVFVIGDADMAPYELTDASLGQWDLLRARFPRMVWLNPMSERLWTVSDTVPVLRRLFPMYTLSSDGIEKAVERMNRKRVYWKR